MLRVVHFEILADDPERARGFYAAVFGWDIQKWEGPVDYWLVTTGPEGSPGINGAIMRREGAATGDSVTAYINTIDVPSVDEFIAKVTARGGAVDVPKTAVPGVGWVAYCRDTEGNVFGMMQIDESAR